MFQRNINDPRYPPKLQERLQSSQMIKAMTAENPEAGALFDAFLSADTMHVGWGSTAVPVAGAMRTTT